MNGRAIVLAMYLKHKGDYEGVYNAIKNKEPLTKEELEEGLKYGDEHNLITIVDNDYPMELRRIPNPPYVIDPNKMLSDLLGLAFESYEETLN